MRSVISTCSKQASAAVAAWGTGRCRSTGWRWALVLAGTLCTLGVTQAEELFARLSEVTGYALIQRGKENLRITSATDLRPGDKIIVTENSQAKVVQGSCTFSLPAGSVYTVKAFPDCRAAKASIARVEPSALPPPARHAPGRFEVDVEAAERALERTLTEQGALLLPKGFAEVTPTIAYTRRETTSPVFALVPSLVLASVDTKRDEVVGNLNLKVGLPWTSQLEIGVPYSYVDQSTMINLANAGRVTTSESSSGFGDVQIALAKQLLREKGSLPDLLFRLIYDTGSGSRGTPNVALNNGYPSLGGQLTALKRQDPLAFVASIAYTKQYERDNIEPGDQVAFSLGAFLAASPNTSLQFSFDQILTRDVRVNGQSVPESNQNQGILSIGASSILAKNVLLNVSFGVGLTNDSPDYFIQVSLPIRFSL